MLIAIGDIEESQWISQLADWYKSQKVDTSHVRTKSEQSDIEMLDSLCDQIVTALGVGYMFGFDMQGALAEVIRSNWSKLENGKPVFDENGKIAKPVSYSKPNLEGFL